MATISEFFERELKVMREASNTDAGITWEIIIGILNRRKDTIWYRDALWCRNILIRSKNSTIRKSAINNRRTRTKIRMNSFVT
jgi:hypothetical protein